MDKVQTCMSCSATGSNVYTGETCEDCIGTGLLLISDKDTSKMSVDEYCAAVRAALNKE